MEKENLSPTLKKKKISFSKKFQKIFNPTHTRPKHLPNTPKTHFRTPKHLSHPPEAIPDTFQKIDFFKIFDPKNVTFENSTPRHRGAITSPSEVAGRSHRTKNDRRGLRHRLGWVVAHPPAPTPAVRPGMCNSPRILRRYFTTFGPDPSQMPKYKKKTSRSKNLKNFKNLSLIIKNAPLNFLAPPPSHFSASGPQSRFLDFQVIFEVDF